jgi:hypothetical protein
MSINYDAERDVYAFSYCGSSKFTLVVFKKTIINQINSLMPADLQIHNDPRETHNDSRSLTVHIVKHFFYKPTRIEVHIRFANDVLINVWFDPTTDEINYSQHRLRMDQLRDENEDLMTSKKFFEMINIVIGISNNHLKILPKSILKSLYEIDKGYPMILRFATNGVHPNIPTDVELSLPPIIV